MLTILNYSFLCARNAPIPVTPSHLDIIVPLHPLFCNCQMRDLIECYDWRLQCCSYCLVLYTVISRCWLCTFCINVHSNKHESSRARVYKNLKTYLCILSLLSFGVVCVCNRTLTNLSLHIVSWNILTTLWHIT